MLDVFSASKSSTGRNGEIVRKIRFREAHICRRNRCDTSGSGGREVILEEMSVKFTREGSGSAVPTEIVPSRWSRGGLGGVRT